MKFVSVRECDLFAPVTSVKDAIDGYRGLRMSKIKYRDQQDCKQLTDFGAVRPDCCCGKCKKCKENVEKKQEDMP
jgi:hypothetical protein